MVCTSLDLGYSGKMVTFLIDFRVSAGFALDKMGCERELLHSNYSVRVC